MICQCHINLSFYNLAKISPYMGVGDLIDYGSWKYKKTYKNKTYNLQNLRQMLISIVNSVNT